jgi:Cys-tRNA(Pro)/Cys-tRNA(Cys) deacylase
MIKNNVIRFLESRKVPHQVFTFSPDLHSAEEGAAALDIPVSLMYKTLVVVRERGRPLLVIVPGDRELDPKRLARSIGEKKLRMATQREAEKLTGLQVGGISVLALLNKGFEVYIDCHALALEYIHVSAGQRGLNIRLKPADLMAITGARAVEATRCPAADARGGGIEQSAHPGREDR